MPQVCVWRVSEGRGSEGVLPEGLYEPLHLLGFPLYADVRLELAQGLVQLHAGEVHLVHHAAEGGGGGSGGRPLRGSQLTGAESKGQPSWVKAPSCWSGAGTFSPWDQLGGDYIPPPQALLTPQGSPFNNLGDHFSHLSSNTKAVRQMADVSVRTQAQRGWLVAQGHRAGRRLNFQSPILSSSLRASQSQTKV